MARPSANLRLFVAVYPPRASAESWLSRLRQSSLPPHRPTPLEQVHLTLQFVGDTPVRDLDRTIDSVQRATSGLAPFVLQGQHLITLPERGRKRLIALETDAPSTLLELQRRLALRLATKPRKNPADRFRPHFTLCRFRSPASMKAMDVAVTDEPFNVASIVVMRSTLAPTGATHHEVASFSLDES